MIGNVSVILKSNLFGGCFIRLMLDREMERTVHEVTFPLFEGRYIMIIVLKSMCLGCFYFSIGFFNMIIFSSKPHYILRYIYIL